MVNVHSSVAGSLQAFGSHERPNRKWWSIFSLLLWLVAGVVAFIPFALDTSPWDAVTLRVPGNQGNWWHLLVGVPFFLAYPMIWLRLRALFSTQPSTPFGRRLIWCAVGLSIAGTVLVEAPFLMHLAGTSEWQRLSVLSLGFGIVIASAAILIRRRREISPTRACLVGLNTAYLANAALCLVVYYGEPGSLWSRAGWLVSIVIVWPMVIEVICIFSRAFQTEAPRTDGHTA